MLRRKNYRSAGSLELGNHGELTQTLPVRKLTSMRVIKYLILILIGVLIHTTYRALFQSDSVPRNSEFRSQVDDKKLAEDHVDKAAQLKMKEERDRAVKAHVDSVFKEARQQFQDGQKDNPNDYNVGDKMEKPIDNPGDKDIFGDKIIDQEEINRNQALFEDENKDNAVDKEAREKELEIEKRIQDTIVKILQEDVADEKLDLDNKEQPINELPSQSENNAIKEENIKENKENENENQKNMMDNEQIPVKSVDDKLNQIIPDNIQNQEIPKEFLGIVKQVEKAESISAPSLHEHDEPPLVTAGTQKNFLKVKQLVKSVQDFLPNTKIHVYDLGMEREQRNELKAGCHVRVIPFLIDVFPDFVKSLKNFHWRPLVIQMAMAEFGHILWLEPGTRVISHKLLDILKLETKIKLLGVKTSYTTNAVTNFKMYRYIRTDRKKIKDSLHVEMKAFLLHNEQEVQENLLKFYVACAMDVKCQAPDGSQNDCDFDVAGREYAHCHRYDESVLNILLKNWFDFDLDRFYISSRQLLGNYDDTVNEKFKLCRNPKDVDRL